jgi:hypothetical protein
MRPHNINALSDSARILHVSLPMAMMYGDQRLTVPEICRTLRISPAMFYRYVAWARRAAGRASCSGGLSRGRTSFDN